MRRSSTVSSLNEKLPVWRKTLSSVIADSKAAASCKAYFMENRFDPSVALRFILQDRIEHSTPGLNLCQLAFTANGAERNNRGWNEGFGNSSLATWRQAHNLVPSILDNISRQQDERDGEPSATEAWQSRSATRWGQVLFLNGRVQPTNKPGVFLVIMGKDYFTPTLGPWKHNLYTAWNPTSRGALSHLEAAWDKIEFRDAGLPIEQGKITADTNRNLASSADRGFTWHGKSGALVAARLAQQVRFPLDSPGFKSPT